MEKRKNSLLALLIAVVIIFSGCATSKSELISNERNMQVWEVVAPTDKVFRAYKDYSEENLSGGDVLWSGGLRVKGYFYGPDAELSIKMEGNPLARVTYLHFELSEKLENTEVKVWYYNGPWKENAEEFKTILPTRVVRAP
ncbi:hypothetical protein [Marinobacter nauticus]|jgi:hypothetical protein|uniref:hypothetical protein n=1 Tax=Marinobacter nauticus TaxID=2743 RepID=UPI00129A4795|nr:hypothetical protein [Marinobacter nauticus]